MPLDEFAPRLFDKSDLDNALLLNNANTPAVSEIDAQELEFLVKHSLYSFAIGIDEVLAFCITFAPGAPDIGVNYEWFSQRYTNFVYLDRIVVVEHMRNKSFGAKLYAAIEQQMLKDRPQATLTCEVNLDPPNHGSLRFHKRIGFEQVGQQVSKPGLTVAMFAKNVDGSS